MCREIMRMDMVSPRNQSLQVLVIIKQHWTPGEQIQKIHAVLSSVVFVILVVLVCYCFHADTYVLASPVKSSLHTAPSAILQKPTLLKLDLSKKRRDNSLNVVCRQKWQIRALCSLLIRRDVNLVRVYDSYVSFDVLVCTGTVVSMIIRTCSNNSPHVHLGFLCLIWSFELLILFGTTEGLLILITALNFFNAFGFFTALNYIIWQ